MKPINLVIYYLFWFGCVVAFIFFLANLYSKQLLFFAGHDFFEEYLKVSWFELFNWRLVFSTTKLSEPPNFLLIFPLIFKFRDYRAISSSCSKHSIMYVWSDLKLQWNSTINLKWGTFAPNCFHFICPRNVSFTLFFSVPFISPSFIFYYVIGHDLLTYSQFPTYIDNDEPVPSVKSALSTLKKALQSRWRCCWYKWISAGVYYWL